MAIGGLSAGLAAGSLTVSFLKNRHIYLELLVIRIKNRILVTTY